MKITEKTKNERAVVTVCIFGQELDQFDMRSNDDSNVTTDVLVDYINTGEGDSETIEVGDTIMRYMGAKVVGILIRGFDDNGDFLRDVLDAAIDIAPTTRLRENAMRLKRCTLPFLGRVYHDATNKLDCREKKVYRGYDTCEEILQTLIANSMIDDGMMSFHASIQHS